MVLESKLCVIRLVDVVEVKEVSNVKVEMGIDVISKVIVEIGFIEGYNNINKVEFYVG